MAGFPSSSNQQLKPVLLRIFPLETSIHLLKPVQAKVAQNYEKFTTTIFSAFNPVIVYNLNYT